MHQRSVPLHLTAMTDLNTPINLSHLSFITRLKLLVLKLALHLSTRRDGTVNRCILSLFDFKAAAPATKHIGTTRVSTADVTVDAPHNLWFRLFSPSDSGGRSSSSSSSPPPQSLPLIVYYHGGGFTYFGPDSMIFDDLCSHIAAKVPAVIASVNYRLAPEHWYPVQYEDSYDALKFIDSQNYAVLPAATDLKKCFLAGDSAGGNIAHHVMVRASQNCHEFNHVKIQGLVLLQPLFGGEERTESELRLTKAPVLNVDRTDWYWWSFLPKGADRNHPAAHVFGGGPNSEIHEDLTNIEFPDVLMIQGGYDLAFHAFYICPRVPEFELLMRDMSNFIEKHN